MQINYDKMTAYDCLMLIAESAKNFLAKGGNESIIELAIQEAKEDLELEIEENENS